MFNYFQAIVVRRDLRDCPDDFKDVKALGVLIRRQD